MERKLGKGLDALISEEVSKYKEKVETIKLSDIMPSPLQPRKRFGEEKMSELVSSIREKGVIQPILVRPLGDDRYELIAGERRWRAAQNLQLAEMPAIVRKDINDVNALEISLIENIQREELNPIEEANAYKDLITRFEYTLDKVGQVVGKDKTTVSNSLRLLTLSSEILSFVEEGKITSGHAKALLSLVNERKRLALAKRIIRKGLSVRETEQIVNQIGEFKPTARRKKDPEIVRIEEELQHKLGTRVNIYQGKKRGRIEIQFFSNEDLQRLLNIIM